MGKLTEKTEEKKFERRKAGVLGSVSEIDDDLADDLWASDVMGLVSAKTASQKIAENAKKDALNHLSSREQNVSIVGMICAKTASKKLMNAKEKKIEPEAVEKDKKNGEINPIFG